MKILSLLNLISIYLYVFSMFKIDTPDFCKTNPLSSSKYQKLVFVVIDGLRIDGAVETEKHGHYFNKLSNLYRKGYCALSFCPNPTLTSTRIKSMINCTESNFIEGLFAFHHKKTRVPGFFEAAKQKSVIFFGDETWTDFFDIKGTKTYNAYGQDFPMEKEIECMDGFLNSISTVDILIGHFSSLDSYGHKLPSINHPKMEEILKMFNNFIGKIIEKIDDNTLFVITSDHGVTDNGDHGGPSEKERSSFVYFIDKKNNPLNEINNFDYNSKEISWLKNIQKLESINQEDIIPTICILLGISIPFNSSGNLISSLVKDLNAYQLYAYQKMKKLGVFSKKVASNVEGLLINYCKAGNSNSELDFYIKLNKFLSNRIKSEICGTNLTWVFLSFIITGISCIMLSFKIVADTLFFLLIGVIIMASHSVYTFIHEDFVWTLLFLLKNSTINNLVASFALCFIGKHPQHQQDRWIPASKVGTNFQENPWFILIFLLFVLFQIYIRRKRSDFLKGKNNILSDIFSDLLTDHRFILITFRYFFRFLSKSSVNLDFVAFHPSLDTLIALIYDPPSAFFLIYLLPYMRCNSLVSFYSLIQIVFFASGFNYDPSAINISLPYIFLENFNILVAFLLFAFQLLYTKAKLIYEFSKYFNDEYLGMAALHFFTVQIVTYCVKDQMVYFLFLGRFFFIAVHFIFENFMHLLLF